MEHVALDRTVAIVSAPVTAAPAAAAPPAAAATSNETAFLDALSELLGSNSPEPYVTEEEIENLNKKIEFKKALIQMGNYVIKAETLKRKAECDKLDIELALMTKEMKRVKQQM